ncbi:MAG: PilZ domain-containing protein [Polyangiaceae bacterium]|nr:PilZ domain-containing protein [Polyangiaceae bacterium]
MPTNHFRATARHQVKSNVTLKITGSAGYQTATLVNLSITGACIEFKDILITGMESLIEISTPILWDPLKLQGRIVWTLWNSNTQSCRAGIQFKHNQNTQLLPLLQLLSPQSFEHQPFHP